MKNGVAHQTNVKAPLPLDVVEPALKLFQKRHLPKEYICYTVTGAENQSVASENTAA